MQKKKSPYILLLRFRLWGLLRFVDLHQNERSFHALFFLSYDNGRFYGRDFKSTVGR